jgi:hypothetical protein
MSFDVDDARELAQVIREGRQILRSGRLADILEEACNEVERLRVANPRVATLDRLRFERDKLRSEVVRMRGEREHNYEALTDGPLGEAMQFRCKNCGKVTATPTVAYFDPCRRQLAFPVLDEG